MTFDVQARKQAAALLDQLSLTDPSRVPVEQIAGQCCVHVRSQDWPLHAADSNGERQELPADTVIHCVQRMTSLALLRHKLGIEEEKEHQQLLGYVGGVSYATIAGKRYLFDGHHNWLCYLLAGLPIVAWEHRANVGNSLSVPRFRSR